MTFSFHSFLHLSYSTSPLTHLLILAHSLILHFYHAVSISFLLRHLLTLLLCGLCTPLNLLVLPNNFPAIFLTDPFYCLACFWYFINTLVLCQPLI